MSAFVTTRFHELGIYLVFCSLEGPGRRHTGTSLVLGYAVGISVKPSALVRDESMRCRAAVF